MTSRLSHSIYPLRRCALVVPLLLIFSGGPALPPCSAQSSDAKLSFAERKQLREWVVAYRRAFADAGERDRLVEKILALGPLGAKELFAVVDKQVQARMKAYRMKFQQQAFSIYRGRTSNVNLAELTQRQNEVLDLRKVDNLTPEMIQQKADPAIEALRELVLLSPETVLSQSDSLREEREELAGPGRIWERCLKRLDAAVRPAAASLEDVLRREEEAAIQFAIPTPPAVRAVFAANARLTAALDRREAEAIEAQNWLRYLLGLEPLAVDKKLCAAARDHSQDMERLKFFSHTSPVEGKTTSLDRARNFGTIASAENIHLGAKNGSDAVRAWFHSPGHFKNILGSHRRIGVGRSGKYYTAMFGR